MVCEREVVAVELWIESHQAVRCSRLVCCQIDEVVRDDDVAARERQLVLFNDREACSLADCLCVRDMFIDSGLY